MDPSDGSLRLPLEELGGLRVVAVAVLLAERMAGAELRGEVRQSTPGGLGREALPLADRHEVAGVVDVAEQACPNEARCFRAGVLEEPWA